MKRKTKQQGFVSLSQNCTNGRNDESQLTQPYLAFYTPDLLPVFTLFSHGRSRRDLRLVSFIINQAGTSEGFSLCFRAKTRFLYIKKIRQ